MYRVYPTADNNFWIDRQVNVVKLEISSVRGADNKIEYSEPPTQDITDDRVILSSTTDDAMVATLVIKKIEGPTVGQLMRGVKFIEAGIMQNVSYPHRRAIYPGKARVFALEGQSFLDAFTDPVDGTVLPWYDSKGATPYPAGMPLPPDVRGAYLNASDPQAGNPITDVKLHVADTPNGVATDSMHLSPEGNPVPDDANPPANALAANRFEVEKTFQLYFAVRTKEVVLGANTVFTKRGATWWTVDGTGTIVATKWTAEPQAGIIRAAAEKFDEVTNGSVVPITTGLTGNEAQNPPHLPAGQAFFTVGI